MPKSVRDIVKEIQAEVLKTPDLLPERAATLLNMAAAIHGNILDEIRTREGEYNKVLLIAYETETKANRAKIRAESDPAYRAWREAKDLKELNLELIRSLKYYLKAKEEEYRLGKYQ